MARLYFQNKQTGKRYQILKHDKEKGVVVLKGDYHQFEEKYDKDRFVRLGYTLVKEDDPDAVEQKLRA